MHWGSLLHPPSLYGRAFQGDVRGGTFRATVRWQQVLVAVGYPLGSSILVPLKAEFNVWMLQLYCL